MARTKAQSSFIIWCYRVLVLLSPWAVLGGIVNFHFQKFVPGKQFLRGEQFFDFVTVTDLFVVVFVMITALGLLTKHIAWEKRQLPWEWNVALILLIIAGGLQLGFQQVYEPILSTPFEYLRSLFVFPLVLMLLIFYTAKDALVQRLVKSYVLMVGVLCGTALVQYFFGWFPGDQHDFMGRMVWPFVDMLTLKASSANWLAFVIMPAFILSFTACFRMGFALLRTGAASWHTNKELLIYTLVMLLSGICLYMTQSYGAYAAAFVGMTLYLFRALPLKKFVVGLGVLLVLAGGVFLHQQTTWKYQVFVGQDEYRFDNSVATRADIYRMNLHMIAEHPLLGVGLNQYQSYFRTNYPAVLEEKFNESHIPPHAHNFFMSFWTSMGVLGFVAMLVLVLGIFWRSKLDPALPAVFVLAAIMTHGLIDSYYWKQEVAYILWLVVLLSYRYRIENNLD